MYKFLRPNPNIYIIIFLFYTHAFSLKYADVCLDCSYFSFSFWCRYYIKLGWFVWCSDFKFVSRSCFIDPYSAWTIRYGVLLFLLNPLNAIFAMNSFLHILFNWHLFVLLLSLFFSYFSDSECDPLYQLASVTHLCW